jgi:hypothetical protein
MSRVTHAPSPPSPRPRRIAPPRWLDLRLVLGVMLVLGAVLIGAKVVSSARQTYPVVAATRDLSAGTMLSSADLRLAQVQLPARGHGVYLTRMQDALGKPLQRAVSAGELVAADAVGPVPRLTTVTVPLASGAAPALRKGQRIELWVSTKSCSSQVLLPDVAVQAVRADDGGSFDSGTGGQDVVISVAPERADRVVQALALPDVQLRAGVLVGAAENSTDPSLPDLSLCAPAAGTR